jgi:long-chain acyl-CoA synthetase
MALTLGELQTHCKESIANYKIPRSLEAMAELPLSGAGKVLKAQLRERFWAGRARRIG